jgi:hypothetical protein
MRKRLFSGFLLCLGSVLAVYSQETATEQEAGKFISFTEGGVLAGNSDNPNNAPFIFHSSLNYAFGKRLSAGIGIGVEFMKETHLPVSVNVLYPFGNRAAVRPFVRLQAGYLFAPESKTTSNTPYDPQSSDYGYYPQNYSKMDSRGGWFLNPSAGIIFYTKQRVGIALSAGYRHQTLHYRGADDYRLMLEQNRLSLTLGLIF